MVPLVAAGRISRASISLGSRPGRGPNQDFPDENAAGNSPHARNFADPSRSGEGEGGGGASEGPSCRENNIPRIYLTGREGGRQRLSRGIDGFRGLRS